MTYLSVSFKVHDMRRYTQVLDRAVELADGNPEAVKGCHVRSAMRESCPSFVQEQIYGTLQRNEVLLMAALYAKERNQRFKFNPMNEQKVFKYVRRFHETFVKCGETDDECAYEKNVLRFKGKVTQLRAHELEEVVERLSHIGLY